MAGNSVEIKIGGDDADLLRAWQRQIKALDKLDSKMNRLGRSGGKSAQKVKGGFDSALGTLGKFAGAITGIGGVVGGISLAARQLFVEFQRIKELQQTDASRQIEFEQSLVQAVRNAAGLFTGQEVKQIALDLEKETGVSPTKIAKAISSALSARGATNREQAQEAIDATSSALSYAPELSADEAAFVAGAGIDISKRFGFTPDQALGFMQNIGGLSRTTDLQKLAKNVVPAVNNLAQYGNTGQEAGSLVTALTQGIGDDTGEMTGTAAVRLAQQIKDRGIGSSTAEGISILQNDPELRKRFFEGGKFDGKKFSGASFEGKAAPTVENLLNKDTFIAKSYIEGIAKIGGAAEAQATFDSTIAENRSITRTSRFQRQAQAAGEAANIQDQAGADAAIARNALAEAFDNASFSDVRKKALLGQFEAESLAGQKQPFEVAQGILRREQDRLLATEKTIQAATGETFGGFQNVTVKDEVTEEEKTAAGVLKRIEDIFSSFIQEQKQLQRQPQPAAPAQQPQAPPSDVIDALVRQNSILEQIFGQVNLPLVPDRRPPFRIPAERLNRGAG